MRCILYLTLVLFVHPAFGQTDRNAITDSIVREGKMLYYSETASWYGTDLFLAKFTNQPAIGGYFSYRDVDTEKCIFYSKGDDPIVIGRILFQPGSTKGDVDLSTVPFTPTEDSLHRLREAAERLVNDDTFYVKYQDMEFNMIPVLQGGKRRVYMLTASNVGKKVAFGNDYLLEFDAQYRLSSRKRLHQNIMIQEFGGAEQQEGGFHSHAPETGDFVTATDICTIMLYERQAGWKQYYVMSRNYVSIWDCEKDDLLVLTMEAWNRINEDQKKRHPKQ